MLQTGCGWEYVSPKSLAYHDDRWCRPVHDDQELFAMLILEGAQAGLSWDTILVKEDEYRRAFDDFDPIAVSQYSESKVAELMMNPGIIRNRRKITAAIGNALAFRKIQEEFGSFDRYIWSFTDGKVIDHHPRTLLDIPTQNELSVQVSKDLKKRGFRFTGPTIIYSYMQGIGIFNDHLETCHCRCQDCSTSNL